MERTRGSEARYNTAALPCDICACDFAWIKGQIYAPDETNAKDIVFQPHCQRGGSERVDQRPDITQPHYHVTSAHAILRGSKARYMHRMKRMQKTLYFSRIASEEEANAWIKGQI
eukprot:18811_1